MDARKTAGTKSKTAQQNGTRSVYSFKLLVECIKQNPNFERSSDFALFGGDNWNRTSDPLHVKQVL